MSIIATSVKRPVTVWMFILATVLFGMVGFARLAVKLLPDLSYPTLTVRTLYDGAAPVEIEQLISKPIEESVGIVKGLRKISSMSRAGLSDVTLEFEWGTNMDLAGLDVREKLDTINLPLDVKKPLLLRFNPNLDPIVRLALSADTEDKGRLKQLRTYADEELKRRLEALPGIASVRLSGGLEQQVHIELKQEKLAQLNITAKQIGDRIAAENINLSAGKVVQGEREYLVRTLNQFKNLQELSQVIVYKDQQKLVRLSEVANVEDAFKERADITRIGNQESIELAIYKEGDANTVAVAKRLKKEIDQINNEASATKLKLIYDQSEFIESAIDEVTSSALIGSLLAMLVIYLFLRDIIPTLIISLSIPLSVIATFNMMFFSHISLNIMSLGGIALAVGLLVDNAIVVLENIDRYKKAGLSRAEAAIKGTKEVSGAIFASTLTTLAVFLPLVFVDGIAGTLFSDQALTVTFALLASLLVALTAIPMLASREGFQAPEKEDEQAEVNPETRLGTFWFYSKKVVCLPFVLLFQLIPALLLTTAITLTKLLAWLFGMLFKPLCALFNASYRVLENRYHKLLNISLKHQWVSLTVAVLLSICCGSLLPRLGMELIPPMNQGEFYVEVQLPPGTEVTQTDKVLQQLAQSIKNNPQVKHLYSQAGSGGLMTSDTNRGGENWGRLQVVLTENEAYAAVSQQLRQTTQNIPELASKIQHPELFSFKTPLEIELSGYDLAQLKSTADKLVNALDNSSRFTDINTSLKNGQPELSIEFDHAKIAALGMDTPTIARRIADRIGGTIASKYNVRDRKVDILVRSESQERDQVSDIADMIINPSALRPIPLSAIADVDLQFGPSAINRVAQQRVAIVSANLAFGDLSEAVTEAKSILAQQQLPISIQSRFGGQNEEMENSFKSLQIALVLAVFLVYLVMASQFESLLHPLLILIAVPMAVSGSIFGLFITQTHLSVIVFIGLIMLAGIVVNNAIVLVDRINQLRLQGTKKLTAIIEAAHSRLRPIMMTTLTTSLGLLPMAIGLGDGAEIRAPMAITVIFGLLLSTLLTLVVIPVLYALFDRKQFNEEMKTNRVENGCVESDL
ncbi:MAG: efflux RND transporter permease subunit [Parashewanella sp.]